MASLKPRGNGLAAALIYTRVSTDDQARDGVSLDTQLAECRRYAAGQGWILAAEYQDILSGKRDDRRQYQLLLTDVRQRRAAGQAVVVVVAALDRFGRRLLERVRCREELKGLGVATHSIRDGGEVSDLVANVLGAVAEEEVRQLGERVSAAKQHLIGGGWYPGGKIPWGYTLRPATPAERQLGAPRTVLAIDEQQAPYVRDVFRRVAEGQSIRSVVRWVGTLPTDARGGRVLAVSGVRRQLSAAVYVARSEHGVPDTLDRPVSSWPALVDDDTWRRVQERIVQHRRMPRQASGRYLLSGLLHCPVCGSRMSGRHQRRRTLRYGCNRSEQPGGVYCNYSVLAPAADAGVLAEIAAVLDPLTAANPRFRAVLKKQWQRLRLDEGAGSADAAQRIRALQRLAERARERLKRAALLLVDGNLDKPGYELVRGQAQADLEATDRELSDLGFAQPVATVPPLEDVLALVDGWAGALDGSSIGARRDVLATLIERIVPRRRDGGLTIEITWTPLGAALRDPTEELTKDASSIGQR